jgi:hypothetical protein
MIIDPVAAILTGMVDSYRRRTGLHPVALAVGDAVLRIWGRARLKAVAAALNLDLIDPDGNPL